MPGRSDRSRRSRPAPKDHPHELVQDAAGVAAIAERLAGRQRVAFDTEFLRERTFFPQLGLIQVADLEDAWLIDPLAVSAEDMWPLIEVFTDPKILKIAHAGEQDQECLYQAYGVVAAPLLDTSIAAALTGRGDQIGLAALLRKTLSVNLPKGHTRTNWLKRPLQQAMAEYAALDVIHLVELGELLLADLRKRGREDWALSLSGELCDLNRYQGNGEGVARRLAASAHLRPREFAILRELADWREKRVRKANIPRRWLAEDSVLVQLTRARPKRVEDLADFRGLGARVRDYGGPDILAAIERGLEKPDDELETPPQKPDPTPREASAMVVLKCFLNFLAQENDVPLRYLIDNDTPLLLLRGDFRTVDDLRASKLLGEGAIDIFGEEILDILSGRIALKIQKGRAVRFDAAKA